MLRPEVVAAILFGLLALGVLLALFAVMRRAAPGPTAGATEQGRFAAALAVFPGAERASRDECLAAAQAAKHLVRHADAEALLSLLLALDSGDGECWLEHGLIAAYRGRYNEALTALDRARSVRADLAESIDLHRAWSMLASGQSAAAQRLFEGIEASLETKLRTELGAGDPAFAEWFLHAGALWTAFGEAEKGAWAWALGVRAVPESLLPATIAQITSPFAERS